MPLSTVPVWPQFIAEAPSNLKFTQSVISSKMELKSTFHPERMGFWTKTLPDLELQLGGYLRKPKPPPSQKEIDEELLKMRVNLPPSAVAEESPPQAKSDHEAKAASQAKIGDRKSNKNQSSTLPDGLNDDLIKPIVSEDTPKDEL